MHLLAHHDVFLDIDPAKVALRFPPEERVRKFGQEGTDAYKKAVAKHREGIVGTLVAFTQKFIDGMKAFICLCLKESFQVFTSAVESCQQHSCG